MDNFDYVLVTPARNEEATIERTLISVINQSKVPVEWVIVSDESSDSTDDIIKSYAAKYSFINYVRIENRPNRGFDSVVFTTEFGIKSLKCSNYDFVGLLDADVQFEPTYFQTLISRFDQDEKLGMAGGLAVDVINGKLVTSHQSLNNVAGAVQFFRRKCFESIGPLIPIPEGGWDAITCVQARHNGYKTVTYPDLIVKHLKPRNKSEGNILRRIWQFGIRDYALATHPFFQILKCCFRLMEYPFFVGSVIRYMSYVWCTITKRKRFISNHTIKIIRQEQIERILSRLKIFGYFKL